MLDQGMYSRSQLGDLHASVPLSQPISILPGGIQELRRVDNNLVQDNALARGNVLDQNMNPGIQSKHETGVGTIEDEVATGEQNFAWGRDGDRTGRHAVGSRRA